MCVRERKRERERERERERGKEKDRQRNGEIKFIDDFLIYHLYWESEVTAPFKFIRRSVRVE